MPSLVESAMPHGHETMTLVGRIHDPEQGGPCVVAVRGDRVVDLTRITPTMSHLMERSDRLALVREAEGGKSWPLVEILAGGLDSDPAGAHLLSPLDLQCVKAAGVTFAKSMVERVVEERAAGDPTAARAVRALIDEALGGALRDLRPGSPEAADVKRVLQEQGLWSQYLEVGIGPDPEIFTKAPVLSTVGWGAAVGVLERSTWNNPEPEVVLVVDSRGAVVGATLGNDVNLRDFEGRSALLLTEAKDNNASCSVGPFLRLFDDDFALDDVAELELTLEITGTDGSTLIDSSSMREMSRTLPDLVAHARGRHHQYPDGFALFTGTLFAPTQDRDEPGQGFTHHESDIVTISTPALGSLVNRVTTSERAPEWTLGIRGLFADLSRRGISVV